MPTTEHTIQKPSPHIIKIAKNVNFEDKSSVSTAIEEIKKMGDYGFNDVAYALDDYEVKRLFSEAGEQGLDYILYALCEEDIKGNKQRTRCFITQYKHPAH